MDQRLTLDFAVTKGCNCCMLLRMSFICASASRSRRQPVRKRCTALVAACTLARSWWLYRVTNDRKV